ncbi:MAG: HRDC domain-containing protein, partial [Syntrophorhabdus sp.]
ALPDSIEEMEDIHGVGRRKLERYGEFFLEAIKEYKKDKGISIEKKEHQRQDRLISVREQNIFAKPDDQNNPKEKKKAEIMKLLEAGKLNASQIARIVGVSPTTVGAYKAHVTVKTHEHAQSVQLSPDDVPRPLRNSENNLKAPVTKNLAIEAIRDAIITVNNIPVTIRNDETLDPAIRKIRLTYKRAYEPWGKDEDDLLIRLSRQTADTQTLSAIFQRQPSAVQARLVKLNAEIVSDILS